MVVHIYRLGRWCQERRIPFLPSVFKAVNRIVFGVVLPPTARLGRGVLLSYQGLRSARCWLKLQHVVVGCGGHVVLNR